MRLNERLRAIEREKPKRLPKTTSKRKKADGALILTGVLVLIGAVTVLSIMESFFSKMPSWFPILIIPAIFLYGAISNWFKNRDR